MEKIHANQKIGDIVNQFPKVIDIYKDYKIDFCCGGDRLLTNAIKEANLNETEILNKINTAYDAYLESKAIDRNFMEEPLDILIDHIVETHHTYLNANLPIINELVTKILRVHGDNHPELLKVHKLFSHLRTELESHMFKEETIQYPAVKEYLKTNDLKYLDKAIAVNQELEDEHTNAGDALKELRILTNDYEVPEDGCSTFMKTYEKLHELEADMFQHIHLENNVLFPRLVQIREKSS